MHRLCRLKHDQTTNPWREVGPQRGNIYKEIEKKNYTLVEMEKKFLTNIKQKGGIVFAKKNMWINIGRNVYFLCKIYCTQLSLTNYFDFGHFKAALIHVKVIAIVA